MLLFVYAHAMRGTEYHDNGNVLDYFIANVYF